MVQGNQNALLRAPEAAAFTGCKRAGFYERISDGLMPEGVSIGGQRRAWPVGELEQINQARIAGKSDDEIRELVLQLETARSGAPATPRRKVRKSGSPLPAAAAA